MPRLFPAQSGHTKFEDQRCCCASVIPHTAMAPGNSAYHQRGRSSTHSKAGFRAPELQGSSGPTTAEPPQYPLSSQGLRGCSPSVSPDVQAPHWRPRRTGGVHVRGTAFHMPRAAPFTPTWPPLPCTHHCLMTTDPGAYGMLFLPWPCFRWIQGPALDPLPPSGRGVQIKTDRRVLPSFRGLTQP